MRKMKSALAAALAGALCLVPVPGTFAVTAHTANSPDYGDFRFTTDDGHVYYLVLSDCTWSEAFERASEAGGYLVNIGGWTEYSTILNKIIDFGLQDYRFRIGAKREKNSREYHWIDEDGEPGSEVINDPSYWSWTRWITGGPSFYANGFDETVISVFLSTQEHRWVWNDVPDDIVASSKYFSGRVGYIVEFDQGSEGYDDAYAGWDQLDGGSYDEATQSGDYYGSYDEATQSGDFTSSNGGFPTYDEANQSGDRSDSHVPDKVGADPSPLLKNVPDNFYFSSGAGAWGTDLDLYDDGSFSGVYHDLNAGEDMDKYPGGTEYLCVFSGAFKNFRKVDDYTWAMDLDLGRLKLESEIGSQWFDERDGIHYVATDPFGIAGGDTFYLYLKGHPIDTLPAGYLNWANLYNPDPGSDTLDVYGIYNVAAERGFWGDFE